MAWSRAAGTSPTSRQAAVGDDLAAGDDDRGHVGGGGREHQVVDGWRGGCRQADRVQGDRDQVGQVAGGEAAGVPAEGGHAGLGGRGQSARPAVALPAGGQALVQPDRPGLLEQVDHGVAVRPQAEGLPAPARARAGPIPSARSRSVVGQRQTAVPVAPRRATSSPVRWVAWTGWSAGPGPGRGGQGGRGGGGGQAGLCSARCSDRCRGGRRAASAQAATAAMAASSTALTLWIPAATRSPGRSARAPACSAQASASPSPKDLRPSRGRPSSPARR